MAHLVIVLGINTFGMQVQTEDQNYTDILEVMLSQQLRNLYWCTDIHRKFELSNTNCREALNLLDYFGKHSLHYFYMLQIP